MKKDIIINFIVSLGIGISLFLVNRYFALYLGTENLGLMKLFTQLLAYLNLAEIGLASASSYAFYKPLAEKKYLQASIIFNTITSLYNKIFMFVIIIGLLLNPIIPFLIKNNIIDIKIYLYWTLYVLSTALNYLFVKYNILFMADQKYSFVRIVQGGSIIFCQLLQIIVIVRNRSFLGFILLLVLNNIIQYIFYKLYFKKYYKYIVKTHERDKNITKNLKNLFWHRMAGLVVFNTDLILISKFISLEVVAVYSSYQMIFQLLGAFLNIILNVLKPKIGKFIAENSKPKIFKLFKKLNILFLCCSIVLAFSTYKLINNFIILWLNKSFILSKISVVLLTINLFVKSFRGVLDIFKEGNGFFDDIHLPIAEAGINFLFSIVLLQYLGLNGIIIGTIISNISIILIAKPILVFRRCFDKNVMDYIKIYGNYLGLTFISLICSNIMLNFIKVDIKISSWSYWILKAFTISSFTLIVTFIIFLSNEDFRENLKVLDNRIRKNKN